MDLQLTDRRALVLAASAGLGRAIAAGLVVEGAKVIIGGRDSDRLAKVVGEIRAVAGVAGDLRQEGEPARIVSEATEILGGLDILVVNTGGGTPGGIVANSEDSEESAYRSMLRPALAAARAGIPALQVSGQGRLLFLTARSILEASPELAFSSVFRSGVAAAARSLAVELAPKVLVNVVVPGQFDTGGYHRFEAWRADHEGLQPSQMREIHVDDIPLGRLGRAEELADVVVFLCSARASYVSGSVIRVDGGAVRGF